MITGGASSAHCSTALSTSLNAEVTELGTGEASQGATLTCPAIVDILRLVPY